MLAKLHRKTLAASLTLLFATVSTASSSRSVLRYQRSAAVRATPEPSTRRRTLYSTPSMGVATAYRLMVPGLPPRSFAAISFSFCRASAAATGFAADYLPGTGKQAWPTAPQAAAAAALLSNGPA